MIFFPYENLSGAPAPTASDTYYACAFTFPKGYDWRRDSLCGSVEASLVVFQNKNIILELEVNPLNRLSGEDDRHWLFGPDLFSTYISNGCTVVKKNGIPLIQWDEEEFVSDILMRDDDIFTLAQSGGGLTLRRNGAVILQEQQAVLLDGMYLDEGQLCLSYARLISSTEGSAARQYFYFMEDCATQVLPPMEAENLYSIIQFNGVTHSLGHIKGTKKLIWQRGPNASIIGYSSADGIRQAELVRMADGVLVHAQLSIGHQWKDVWWENGRKICETDLGMQVLSCSRETASIHYICSEGARSSQLDIYWDGYDDLLEDNYQMFCGRAAYLDDKNALVGMNDSDESMRPVILKNGKLAKYDFNGYFTRFSLP